jgi:hypothetical protein
MSFVKSNLDQGSKVVLYSEYPKTQKVWIANGQGPSNFW